MSRQHLPALVARIVARFQGTDNLADEAQRRQRRIEVAMVAQYMAGQASGLRYARDSEEEAGSAPHVLALFQAGAAGAEAMSELLLATATGDKARFKAVFNEFVDGALEAGVAPT